MSHKIDLSAVKKYFPTYNELFSAICELNKDVTFKKFIQNALPIGFDYTLNKNLFLGLHILENRMYDSFSNLAKIYLSIPENTKYVESVFCFLFKHHYKDIKGVFFSALDYTWSILKEFSTPKILSTLNKDEFEKLFDQNKNVI